jgi:hypothetical protein
MGIKPFEGSTMKKTGLPLIAFGLLVGFSLPTTSAQAQATRTWVSGVGDDVNPCSRTAPCKTFAGAISKTAAGGEIDCLDPGGFGAVTIGKSLTIDCTGVTGGILAAGVNGVIVNGGASDKIVLRNLVIQGSISVNTGINGIRYLGGSELHLDRVVVQGFTTLCVDVSTSTAVNLYVNHSYFTECPTAINLLSSNVSFVIAHIDNSYFLGMSANGVAAAAGNAIANISNSVFANILGNAVSASASTSRVDVNNSVFSNNSTAMSAVSGAILRTVTNTLYDNTTGISANGASWQTAGDNKVAGGTTTSIGTSTAIPLR